MGVRRYNPVTARFLQVHPAVRGSANAYEYCFADPINCSDINGMFGVYLDWKKNTFTFVFSPAETKFIKELGLPAAVNVIVGGAAALCGDFKETRSKIACGAVAAGITSVVAGIVNLHYREGKILIVQWRPGGVFGTGVWSHRWQDPPKGKITHPEAIYVGHLKGGPVGSRLVGAGGGSK
ncbi:RHS repeat-associated core domain-containing protein [Streptosporangium sp. G11]|uniref:RHS repeat-associated core domain-containing protein n=1 Tax=Streptosporangium sp. G11 TaxID=3436926 RepID=UPI003EC10206